MLEDPPAANGTGAERTMNLTLSLSSIALERDQLIAVRDAVGLRVSCLDGALWITQESMAADVVLEAGQSFVVDAPGLTLLMALSPSTLQLRERVGYLSGWRQTLASWLGARPLRPSGVH
jgi:hypothetical protein